MSNPGHALTIIVVSLLLVDIARVFRLGLNIVNEEVFRVLTWWTYIECGGGRVIYGGINIAGGRALVLAPRGWGSLG